MMFFIWFSSDKMDHVLETTSNRRNDPGYWYGQSLYDPRAYDYLMISCFNFRNSSRKFGWGKDTSPRSDWSDVREGEGGRSVVCAFLHRALCLWVASLGFLRLSGNGFLGWLFVFRSPEQLSSRNSHGQQPRGFNPLYKQRGHSGTRARSCWIDSLVRVSALTDSSTKKN